MKEQIRVIKILSLALVLCLWTSASFAADEAEILDLLNSGDDVGLNARKLLAEKFSNKVKYLDISYVKPDDDGLNAGWNAKYNLKYGTSGGSGFKADAGRFALDAFAAELDITGSYSFADASNVDDLSTVNFSLSYLNVDLGELNMLPKKESLALQECIKQVYFPKRPDFENDDAFFEAADKAEVLKNECRNKHYKKPGISAAKNPRSYSLDIHGLVEGNQDYSSRNTAYGFQGLYSAKGYPSFRIDFERVDASENETRREVTSDDEFDRISGEIGYGYSFGGSDGYPVWIYASYRIFHELSAPSEIKDADLETFDYLALAVRFPARKFGLVETEELNLFIRYTDGQLPFDRQDDKAIEFGFSTNIEILKALL